jgi:hypothetical protein
MNLRDFALVLPELAALSDQRNLWMVVGSATATGKTQAMRDLARHFAGQGTTPIGIKVAGIAGMRDLEVVRRAGAAAVYDFLDLGVGRAELDDVEGLRQRTLDLIRYVEAVHPGGLILCEVGGSVNIFQQIIAARELRPKIAGIVLCASDPIALLGMLYLLEPTGPLRQKIIAAAGPCVNNAPLRRKVWQQSGLPSLAEYLNMHK